MTTNNTFPGCATVCPVYLPYNIKKLLLAFQGAAAVGLKSKTHAVIVAVKVAWISEYGTSFVSVVIIVTLCVQRASSELSAHQKKIHPIDDHVGIAVAGLASDGRLLRLVNILDYIYYFTFYFQFFFQYMHIYGPCTPRVATGD